MNDNSTHAVWNGLWVQGFHNTTNTACGFANSANDFESLYVNSAIEANDVNGCIGMTAVGQTMEKITFDTVNFENLASPNGKNILIGPSAGGALTIKQFRFRNIHISSSTNASVDINAGVTTPVQDQMVFDEV